VKICVASLGACFGIPRVTLVPRVGDTQTAAQTRGKSSVMNPQSRRRSTTPKQVHSLQKTLTLMA
jgi:hypothetical protein